MSDNPASSAIAAKSGVPVAFWLIAAMFPALFACSSAIAQVGAMPTTPTLGATSPLGSTMSVEPAGIPLGSTEITSAGLSPAPNGVTGTISVPSTASGTACSTVGTSPSSMFGSTASFDGGGMGSGAPASATTSSNAAMSGISSSANLLGTSGVSTTSGTLDTAGMSGMCGSGSSSVASSSTPTTTAPTVSGGVARTGIPLGSFEIGNLGVSSAAAVPLASVSPTVAAVGSVPTMPTITSLPAVSSTATNPFPCQTSGMSNTANGC